MQLLYIFQSLSNYALQNLECVELNSIVIVLKILFLKNIKLFEYYLFHSWHLDEQGDVHCMSSKEFIHECFHAWYHWLEDYMQQLWFVFV